MTEVKLKVAGKEFLDFFNLTIRYSMESFAREFTFDFTDRFLNDLTTLGDLPFVDGDPVQIEVDGELLIDGYIDDIPISYDANNHTLQVTGRSKQMDLIDCSAVHATGHWKDATLLTLCTDVAKPFGISVAFDPLTVLPFDPAQTEKFRKWAIEDEETGHDFIVRACRMRGLFAVPDEGPSVIITKASAVPGPGTLVRSRDGIPGNILRGSRVGRYRERYSEYIVKGQSAGFDDWYGNDAVKGVHIAKDEDITRYRPLVLASDGGGQAKELEQRANWERNVRAGRSRRLTYDVQGTQQLGPMLGGGVWAMNTLVYVDDDFLGVQGLLLIIGVTIRHSNSGTITTLEVGDPAQFDVLKPPTKRPARKKGRSFI